MKILMVATLSAGLMAAATSVSADTSATHEIAPGVFQTVGQDGAITTEAFGDDGARYDLMRFTNQLNTVLANKNADRETVDALRRAVSELSERVQKATATSQVRASNSAPLTASPVQIDAWTGLYGYNNTPTPACAFVAHQLADFTGDASINPGGGGGTATSSVVYYVGENATGTAYTATIYASASYTLGTTTTVAGSTSVSSSLAEVGTPVLFKRTASYGGYSFSVSASTSSYINIVGCTGGYQSYTKSQTL